MHIAAVNYRQYYRSRQLILVLIGLQSAWITIDILNIVRCITLTIVLTIVLANGKTIVIILSLVAS